MNFLRHPFLLLLLVFAGIKSQGQCPGCVPDVSCTISPAFPTMCPAQPPAATAGVEYEADFTFWMPSTFSDPGSGVTVNFDQMTVTGVSGLPFGLAIETSDPAGVYFPQQNQFGCARICGTPLIPGTYNITISILATVSIGGFTTQVPEQFVLILNVLPGAGGNNSFSFDPTSGCGSVTATFQALIDGGASPTTYTWDLGNGETSTVAQPPPQTYDEPGEYHITLETQIGGYVLDVVNVTGVNDNWCGDIEEPNLPFLGCSGAPDLYVVLTDANGNTWTSGTHDDTFFATWSGLGVVLSDPPYSLSVWDEDWISPDDHLGTYNIPIDGAGTYYFNVAGGTTGSLTISLQTQQVFTDTDTVVVHPLPMVAIMQQGDQLCATDTSLVGFTWILDGDTLPGMANMCIPATPGTYTLVAVSGQGCANSSAPFIVCPSFIIETTENILHVPGGYQHYQWTLNGSPAGTGQPFLIVEESGSYAVTVNAGNDCIVTATLDLLVGVLELEPVAGSLSLYPNPSDGLFTIEAEVLSGTSGDVEVFDMAGRSLLNMPVQVVNGGVRQALAISLSPGMYILHLRSGTRSYSTRFSIR